MAPPFELNTAPIDEETRKIAENELRETPENVKKGIEELRELLKNDPTIHFKDDDETLKVFLRPCKFYSKSTFELMKRISDFKVKYKDILENLLPEDEKEAFTQHNVVNVLTNRDHKGRRVLLVNVGEFTDDLQKTVTQNIIIFVYYQHQYLLVASHNSFKAQQLTLTYSSGTWDTSKVTADQLFRIFYLIHEAAVLEPETQVRGVVVIMDFDNLSLKQIAALTPAVSMRLLSFIQDAMPLRLKEVHMVKQPFIFKMVWAIFKPFIREKLKNRIFFHGSKMASLHKHMDPSHLPQDYDGQMPKINYTGADWYPVIEKYVDHIRTWNTFGHINKMVFCVEVGEDNVPFVQVGEHQLRLDLEELNEEYKERAKNELRETPEIIESALRKLREYIMAKWNPKLVTLQDMFRGLMIAIEIAMIEPKTQVAGVHVIINVKGFSLTHVCQFSPFHAKLLLDYAQLHFHGANTLCEKISPESLPESIGGTGSFPEYPGKLLSEMFFYYEDLFK
ncbi:retinaldehyde-binding protein 1, partial [Asbolus verrucosus]